MAVSKPLEIDVPPCEVYICESIHGPDFQMEYRADPFHKLIFVYKGTTTYSDRSAGNKPPRAWLQQPESGSGIEL